MRTAMLVLAGLLVTAGAGRADEKLTTEERARLEEEAATLNRRAVQLYEAGGLVKAAELAARALELRRRLYPHTRTRW